MGGSTALCVCVEEDGSVADSLRGRGQTGKTYWENLQRVLKKIPCPKFAFCSSWRVVSATAPRSPFFFATTPRRRFFSQRSPVDVFFRNDFFRNDVRFFSQRRPPFYFATTPPSTSRFFSQRRPFFSATTFFFATTHPVLFRNEFPLFFRNDVPSPLRDAPSLKEDTK